MKLDHVSLHVVDIEVAVDFYSSVFDLKEIEPTVNVPGVRWLEFANGTALHLIPNAPHDKAASWGDLFAMICLDFDAVVEGLRKKAIAFGTPQEPANNKIISRQNGSRAIFLLDPDNNLVEING